MEGNIEKLEIPMGQSTGLDGRYPGWNCHSFLDDARIAGVNLHETNLRGAHLNAVKMAEVDLKEADLTGANLSQSRLIGVDVVGADFSDVTTTYARAVVKWSRPEKLT